MIFNLDSAKAESDIAALNLTGIVQTPVSTTVGGVSQATGWCEALDIAIVVLKKLKESLTKPFWLPFVFTIVITILEKIKATHCPI